MKTETQVIESAARQVVRFARWSDATLAATHKAKKEHDERRSERIYLKAVRPPQEPATPKNITAKAWEKHPIFLEYCAKAAEWQVGLREAQRDKRGAGHDERRGLPFPEPTGDDVIESFTKGDYRRYHHIACRALDLAKNPAFRQRSGRPSIAAEVFAEAQVFGAAR